MKLKNKKTGEIKEFVLFDGKNELQGGATLKDLVKEWEDYEEPKGYWYIGADGSVNFFEVEVDGWCLPTTQWDIGNHFDTREEAEKAVKKLEAWKRLKDKGFRFIDHIDRDSGQGMTRYEWDGYVNGEDLDLLFGGEE